MLQAIVGQGTPPPLTREKRYIRKDGSTLWAQFLSADHAKAAEVEDAKLLISGKTIVAEGVIKDGDGNNRDIIRHISRFTNADGSAVGIIGVLTDFTDFKQVSRALV